MNAIAEPNPVLAINPKSGVLWTGRVVSGLATLFFLWDAVMKIIPVQAVVEATTKLGFPAGSVQPIGLTLLAITVLFAIPRTAIIGAVLLTAYLGGATATMVHAGQPIYFPVLFGVIVWTGLVLRRPNLLSLVK